MARAMSASGFLKPKATRVMSLILVFMDSMRPLVVLSPQKYSASDLGFCVVGMSLT